MAELIELNAHMEMTGWALSMVTLGTTIAACACLVGVVWALIEKDWRIAAAFAFVGMLGAAMIVIGVRQPRDRIITACLSGPVSIEDLEAKYDVIEIDGKLLRLRER